MSTDHVQARTETSLLDFDGRVLEIFSTEGSTRILASELTYNRSEPDKKGRVNVTLTSFGRGVFMLVLQPEYVADIDQLLAALDKAKA
jgi:hypothetical protein